MKLPDTLGRLPNFPLRRPASPGVGAGGWAVERLRAWREFGRAPELTECCLENETRPIPSGDLRPAGKRSRDLATARRVVFQATLWKDVHHQHDSSRLGSRCGCRDHPGCVGADVPRFLGPSRLRPTSVSPSCLAPVRQNPSQIDSRPLDLVRPTGMLVRRNGQPAEGPHLILPVRSLAPTSVPAESTFPEPLAVEIAIS